VPTPVHTYRFRWTCAYMGVIEYEVAGDGPAYRVELRREAPDYEQAIYSGSDEQWQREVVGAVGLLRRMYHSGDPIPQAVIVAFNAWRASEHERLIADIRREGGFRVGASLPEPPAAVQGGIYLAERGWVPTG
jgi:hypothetical protein